MSMPTDLVLEQLPNGEYAWLRPAPRLCGAEGTRNRVCAAPAGHTGPHQFMLRTERED